MNAKSIRWSKQWEKRQEHHSGPRLMKEAIHQHLPSVRPSSLRPKVSILQQPQNVLIDGLDGTDQKAQRSNDSPKVMVLMNKRLSILSQ